MQLLLVLVLAVRKIPVLEKSLSVVGGHDDQGTVEPKTLVDEPKEPPQCAVDLQNASVVELLQVLLLLLREVDVRIVAATNRNLEEEVAAGRFREDLYYRLSVFPMELPPLRERVEDIVPLASHFLDTICAELGREPLDLTKMHTVMLQKHHWPGNIRELRNVIERAVIMTKGARLRLDLAMGGAKKPESVSETAASEVPRFLTEEEFRGREKRNLVAALRAADWRVWGPDGAAAMLGIKPSTLSYRMHAFGIEKGS